MRTNRSSSWRIVSQSAWPQTVRRQPRRPRTDAGRRPAAGAGAGGAQDQVQSAYATAATGRGSVAAVVPHCHGPGRGGAAASAALRPRPPPHRRQPPPPAALPQMLLRGRFASHGRFAAGSRGRFAAVRADARAGLGRGHCSAALPPPPRTLPASAPQTVRRRPPLHRRLPQVPKTICSWRMPVAAGRGGVAAVVPRRAPLP